MGLKSRVSEAEKKTNVGLRDYNYGQSGAFLRSLEMKIDSKFRITETNKCCENQGINGAHPHINDLDRS